MSSHDPALRRSARRWALAPPSLRLAPHLLTGALVAGLLGSLTKRPAGLRDAHPAIVVQLAPPPQPRARPHHVQCADGLPMRSHDTHGPQFRVPHQLREAQWKLHLPCTHRPTGPGPQPHVRSIDLERVGRVVVDARELHVPVAAHGGAQRELGAEARARRPTRAAARC